MSKALRACLLSWLMPAVGLAQGFDPLNPLPPAAPERPWLASLQVAASHQQVAAGGTLRVALDVHLKDGWVFYSPDPGSVVQPGGLTVGGGPFHRLRDLWPMDRPHASPEAGVTNHGYEGRLVVFVEMRAPPDAKEGAYTLTLSPAGQACGIGKTAACIAVDLPSPAEASVTVRVGPSAVENPAWAQYAPMLAAALSVEELKSRHAAEAAPTPSNRGPDGLTVWAGLGLSLLAGLILNVMPCVLPVIPLKVLGIVQTAGESRRRFIVLGLAFAGGIMLFFLGLATANAVLRLATGQAFNWGEHFQSVSFRVAMAMLLVAVAANLFGLFTVTVPGRIASLANGQAPGGPYRGLLSSLGSGILTAVLSTPCSFAILTLSLAWGQTQAVWLGTLAILTVGAGMALPYAILTACPSLVARLPKPGRWMELFKQAMGFLLLIVAIWLIGSVSDYSYPLWVVAYGAVLVFCLWAWGAWVRHDSPLRQKVTIRGLAVLLAAMAGVWMLRPPQPLSVRMEPFSAAKIEQARRDGRIVLVDFTASWCLTCKTVETWVYDDEMVAQELTRRDVLAMKGDISTADLPANKTLFQDLREPGVPVTVIFPPYAGDPSAAPPPIRLRGIFSRAALTKALDDALRKPSAPAGP